MAQDYLGCTVIALKPDLDCDENDNERPIPVGTRGVIERLNHVDSKGERHYDVIWANGGWTVYSDSEMAANLKIIEG